MGNKLFYEYAITPDVFENSYFETHPSFYKELPRIMKKILVDGMIANLNKDGWIKHLKSDILPTITNIDFREQLISFLNILHDRNRLVRHPKSDCGEPKTALDWLEIAMESHRQIKFDTIISSEKLIQEYKIECDVIDAQKVLDSPEWGYSATTLTLNACEPYYRPVLDPILRHARALTIVDPYFSPHHSRFIDFLKICMEQMGKRGKNGLKGRIIIHAGNPENEKRPETVTQRLDAWESKIRSIYPSSIPHTIRIYLRERKTGGPRFHDRYIFTDQYCSVHIPMGTDTYSGETSDSTTWALESYEDMIKKQNDIAPENDIFR